MKPSCFVALAGIALIALHGTVGRADSTVEFAVTNYTGIEGTTIKLQLVIDPPLATTNTPVTLATTGGSADAADFSLYAFFSSPPGATFPIPVDKNDVFAWVSLTDDGLPEGDETIELTLMNPTGGLVLGARTRAVVTIRNAGPRFEMFGGGADEESGAVEVGGYRSGGTNVAFTVDYVTIANGTAVPGVNFVPTNGTISVAAGERYSISFRIPVINDGVVAMEGRKTFGIYLTNATAGVEVSTEPMEVSIWDSQWPTTLDLNYEPPVQGFGWQSVPNGKIVGLEPAGENVYRLVRLNADGSLDVRSSPILFRDTNSFVSLQIVAAQSDGKILVAGAFTSINGVQLERPGFARLSPDGSLDRSFIPAISWDYGCRPKPLADGRILVFDGDSLRALNANGVIDSGFQAAGPIQLHALAEDAQGKLIVAADFAPLDGTASVTIIRMNKDGSRDPTFVPPLLSTNESAPRTIDHILIQADGKILIAESFYSRNESSRFKLVRLEPDGSADETFDAGPPLPLPYICCRKRPPVILNGDKILIAWSDSYEGNGFVRRFNSDGSLAKEFPVRFQADPPWIDFMTVQGESLFVAGSFYSVNEISKGGLTRLLLDDAPESAAVIAPKLAVVYEPSRCGQPENFEGMGEAEITVRRVGDVRGPATVAYRTQDGSAKAGQDYTTVAGTVSFGPLETEKSFRLPILDETEFEADETVELVLSPGSGVAAVGSKTLFAIHDDEVTIRGTHLWRNDVASYVSFTFNCVPGQLYLIEASTDLRSWQQVGNVRKEFGESPRYNSRWDLPADNPSRPHWCGSSDWPSRGCHQVRERQIRVRAARPRRRELRDQSLGRLQCVGTLAAHQHQHHHASERSGIGSPPISGPWPIHPAKAVSAPFSASRRAPRRWRAAVPAPPTASLGGKLRVRAKARPRSP